MNLKVTVFTYYIAKVVGQTSQNKEHVCMVKFISEETAKKWMQETVKKFMEIGMPISYKGIERHTIETLEETEGE